MKMTGCYANTTNNVRFEDEYNIELITDIDGEILNEPFEIVDITEVVYLNNVRFVIDDTITYETGKAVFATRYDNNFTEKTTLHLTSDWYANEYTFTITTWKL